MKEQAEVAMIKRGNIEWNLNTILQLVTLGSTLILVGATWQSLKGDVTAINTWISNHEILERDRLAHIKETEGTIKEHIRTLDTEVRRQSTITENITIRQSITEQNQSAMLQTMKEIQSSFSEYSSEQKVQREILQRIEASLKAQPIR